MSVLQARADRKHKVNPTGQSFVLMADTRQAGGPESTRLKCVDMEMTGRISLRQFSRKYRERGVVGAPGSGVWYPGPGVEVSWGGVGDASGLEIVLATSLARCSSCSVALSL